MPENPETAAEGRAVPPSEINDAENGDSSKLTTDRALEFIEASVSDSKPFLAVIWYHTPHKPVVDPSSIEPTDTPLAAKRAIEAMDSAIGTLRSRLNELGVRENTMVFFTSDNGPEDGIDSPHETNKKRPFRSGHLLKRKRSLSEGGIRVPSLLEWPAEIQTGATTAYLSSTSDYYPTILDFLGLQAENQKPLDGESLRPTIENAEATRKNPIGFLIRDRKAWISQTHKLVDDGGGWKLYDMTLPDSEMEKQPLDTEKGEPAAEIRSEMFNGFQKWKESVDTDSAPPSS